MPEEIVVAATDADYEAFTRLIDEYFQWMRARYAEQPGFIDAVGGHQGIDDELRDLRAKYGPPAGRTLLAVRDGEVTGCVALKDLHDGSCEMKRLFLPDRYRGQGTGRRLCEALIDSAAADGYRLMRLDTGFLHAEATAMYEGLGFRACEPYLLYPAELMPHLRFMERELT